MAKKKTKTLFDFARKTLSFRNTDPSKEESTEYVPKMTTCTSLPRVKEQSWLEFESIKRWNKDGF